MATVIDMPVSTPDYKLVPQDMSLKVVLTYFFYTDDISAAVEQRDGSLKSLSATEAVADKDLSDLPEKNLSDLPEKDFSDLQTKLAKESCTENSVSDSNDFDSTSLDEESSGKSNHLQSFSLMNIFDTVCEDSFDFTGSLDFVEGNMCRDRTGTDADKVTLDTLDWLSDSSEDAESSTHEEKNEHEMPEKDESVMTKGDNVQGATSGTKSSYKGSTISVGKVKSESRHKLVRRLFRKVFPKKKYVVNKKK